MTLGGKPLKILTRKMKKVGLCGSVEKRKEKIRKSFWKKSEEHILRNSFYFSFFSNFDRLGTNLVPIEQGRELLKISFKLSISWKLTLIDWNMNKSYSIDRKPIEPTREQWLKIKEFLINWKTHSIDWNSGNLNFWKTAKDYVETTQPKWLFGGCLVLIPYFVRPQFAC